MPGLQLPLVSWGVCCWKKALLVIVTWVTAERAPGSSFAFPMSLERWRRSFYNQGSVYVSGFLTAGEYCEPRLTLSHGF